MSAANRIRKTHVYPVQYTKLNTESRNNSGNSKLFISPTYFFKYDIVIESGIHTIRLEFAPYYFLRGLYSKGLENFFYIARSL